MLDMRFVRIVLLAAALMPAESSKCELTRQQAERIEAAIPKKASVTPKKDRRVLIWNTPRRVSLDVDWSGL